MDANVSQCMGMDVNVSECMGMDANALMPFPHWLKAYSVAGKI